jgi:HAD superfamily hydrolase (TIGR01509 family)
VKLNRSFFTALNETVFVFDKDGTLIDTESLYFEAFNRLLTPYGCRHDFATHASMMGASADTCLRILGEKHPVFSCEDARLPQLRAELLEHVSVVRGERGTRPMPGAIALLEACRGAGVRLAMATSATRENTDRDLRELGWRDFFEAVVTADDVSRHKPAPDVYLEAAARMGIEPALCIAFEDGIRGTESADAAGMRVIFIRDERFAVDPPAVSHHIVHSLEELLIRDDSPST